MITIEPSVIITRKTTNNNWKVKITRKTATATNCALPKIGLIPVLLLKVPAFGLRIIWCGQGIQKNENNNTACSLSAVAHHHPEEQQ